MDKFFKVNYSCSGRCECKKEDCLHSQDESIFDCKLTTPEDCSKCSCQLGCNY